MTPIYIAGIAMTVIGRHTERSLDDLAGEGLQGAVKDAGCRITDLGAAHYAGMTNGPLQGHDVEFVVSDDLVRALCVETHETGLEDSHYLNMSLLKVD